MSKCFISYRHINPDEELAGYLDEFLTKNKHQIFTDKHLNIGDLWSEVIAEQIKKSEFFIVLISPQSIRSEMVVQEVKMAHGLAHNPKKPLVILPVRVDFEGELPYELGAYLDRIQYALWKPDSGYEEIGGQILDAIAKRTSLPFAGKEPSAEASVEGINELFDATEGRGVPLPAADPRFIPHVESESGTMRLDSQYYIRRKSDEQVESLVVSPGTTTIIKAPRQMGKSSLLARAHAVAKAKGLIGCYIDFQMIDQSRLLTLELLLEHLARKLDRELKTPIKAGDVWDSTFGAKESLTCFVADAVLAQSKEPVVILLDEVDRIFEFDYRDDFFALIRSWHNLRAMNSQWQHFNIVIAHSTEPSLWIQDIHQSPFNVGTRIQLQEFDAEHVAQLNKLYHHPLRLDGDIRQLLEFLGGQPYLIRQSFVELVNRGCSLDSLFLDAVGDDSPFRDHLRRILWCLQQNESLTKSLRLIMRQGRCDDEYHFQMLQAAGLIRGDERLNVRPRCRLYDEFFRRHL